MAKKKAHKYVYSFGAGKADELGLQTLRKVAGRAAKKARAMEAGRVLVQVPAVKWLVSSCSHN